MLSMPSKLDSMSLAAFFAYMAYSEAENQPPKLVFLGIFNGIYKVCGRFLTHTFNIGNLLGLQIIYVGGLFIRPLPTS